MLSFGRDVVGLVRFAIALVVVILLGCTVSQTLEGRVNLFGPSSTAYVGMDTLQGRHVRLTGPLADDLRKNYQGQQVRLEVVQTGPEKGPGMPAHYEVRRILGRPSP